MYQKLVTVHGFNVSDGGAATIDSLKPHLKDGYEVGDFNYGWTGLLGALYGNQRRAVQLSKRFGDCIPLAHSNGAAIVHRAAMLGAFEQGVILLNPALDRNIVWPAHVKKVYVYYSSGDVPTKLARYIPFVKWGASGFAGALTNDPRVVNVKTDASGWPAGARSHSHSGMFSTPMSQAFWAKHIESKLRRMAG